MRRAGEFHFLDFLRAVHHTGRTRGQVLQIALRLIEMALQFVDRIRASHHCRILQFPRSLNVHSLDVVVCIREVLSEIGGCPCMLVLIFDAATLNFTPAGFALVDPPTMGAWEKAAVDAINESDRAISLLRVFMFINLSFQKTRC